MREAMSRRTAGADTLIAAAAEWRLIGLLLERPRRGWHEEIAALAVEVHGRRLRVAARAAQQATEGEYLSLLGPGGVVSPRAVTYRPFEDPGQILATLNAAYEAFAYHPRAEDPIDHIAVEVGFVAYLLLKEAFARAADRAADAKTTAVARRSFMGTHLASLAAHFARRLEPASGSYIVDCAQLLHTKLPRVPISEIPDRLAELPEGCGACAMPERL
jgi:hypothetical protein